MPLVALHSDSGDLMTALDPAARGAKVQCPDPKCASKMHWVRPLLAGDGEVVLRCAFFRHTAGSGCPWGDRSGGERMTPWHTFWQTTCDDLARIEVSHQYDGGHVRADVIGKDSATAIEFQHSALDQGTITRRENAWAGRVVWVFDAASADREGEARISGGTFDWTSTAGLHNRIWRTVTFVDIGGNTLVELPRGWAARSTLGCSIPADRVRVWTRDQFVGLVVNGERMPFDFDTTAWQQERRRSRQRDAAERAQDRERQRARKLAAQMAGGTSCEYSGADRGGLVKAEPADEAPWSGDHQCVGCGKPAAARPGTRCERCWGLFIASRRPPPLSRSDRQRIAGMKTAPRDVVVTALADLHREAGA